MSQLKAKQSFLIEASLDELESLLSAARNAYQTMLPGDGVVLGTFNTKTQEGNIGISISIAVMRDSLIDLPPGSLS